MTIIGPKLPLPLYLNDKTVVDISAILNGGFSEYEELKSKNALQQKDKSVAKTSVGTSLDGFSIVKVGASIGSESELAQESQQERSRRVIQTNTSLLFKLRNDLYEQRLISESIATCNPGEFIEFRATFRKIPLEELLDCFENILTVESLLTAKPTNKSRNSSQLSPELRAVKEMLQQSNTIDILSSEINGTGIRSIVQLDRDIVGARQIGDIVMGEYYVLGKIVSLIGDGSQWNTLAKTPLGAFRGEAINQLESGMRAAASQMEGIANLEHKFSLQIKGPLVVIHPVAIYS